MLWLRSAALYLILTLLIGGSVWLFWGKAIEKQWRSVMADRKMNADKPSNAARQKTRRENSGKIDTTEIRKISPAEEWRKAQSGVTGLIAIEVEDNRRRLRASADSNDAHWRDLLGLKSVTPPERQQPVKPAVRQLAKSEELRPSKRKAK